MTLLRRILAPIIASLIALSPMGTAAAMTQGQKAVVLNSVPNWVLRAGGAIPALDIDFANNRAWLGGSGGRAPQALITVTRASNETSLLPTSASGAPFLTFGSNVAAIVPGLGLQIYQAATNFLLNSTAPATQTTGSLSTGTYTLWVNGSGSATMSSGTATGCGTGTATNGTPVTFTITVAGTCTVTKSGSLNAFQLESGTFGTPLIVTAGATATRASDVVTLAGAALTAALSAKSMLFINNGSQAIAIGSTRAMDFNSSGTMILTNGTTVTISSGGNSAAATLGSGSTTGLAKAAYGFDASSMTAIANGGTKATTSNAWTAASPVYVANNSAGTKAINGFVQRISFGAAKGQFDGNTQ